MGTHTIGLQVTDTFNAIGTDTTTLSIYTNEPTASFTANPNPAAPGQAVTFDASASSHGRPDRSIVQYEWDWEYDGSFNPDASGVQATHAYTLFGSYTAALRVTDDNAPAKTDIATTTIAVNQGNQAPTADANGPYMINEGDPLTLDASGSSDPNEAAGDSIVSYDWDLDDDGDFDDATGETPTVPWSMIHDLGLEVGYFPLHLKVVDTFGGYDTVTTELTIINTPPVADADGPYIIDVGDPLTLDASGSSDPNEPLDEIVSWDWDMDYDGQFDDATGVSPTVPWTTLDGLGLGLGTHTIALKVTDTFGAFSTDTTTLSIVDVTPPEIIGPADVTIECDESVDPSNTGMPTVTDNYDPDPVISYSDSIAAGACPQEYVITRTWTATDASDNSSSQTQVITVVDTTAPVLAGVPADVTVECDAVPAPASPTATDNGDPEPAITFVETSTQGDASEYAGHNYTLTRTWTATDNCGNSSSQTQVITVQDTIPPVVDHGGPYEIDEGDPLTLDASDSWDTHTHTLTFSWDLDGDGDFEDAVGETPTLTWSDLEALGINDDGSYDVAVWVGDPSGNSTIAFTTLTVNNLAPTIALIGAADVDEGLLYTLTLGTVTDPGDDTIVGTGGYIAHWGDGSSDTYDAPGDVTHTYADGPATPTITVDLVDEDGTHSGAGTLSLTVNDVSDPVAPGETASIGFWRNKHGQALIRSLNGDENSTLLGDWLAETLPNMFGADAGENNLAGKTNVEVAEFYLAQFSKKKKDRGVPGPAKVDVHLMATALSTYVTNLTLVEVQSDPPDPENPEDPSLVAEVESYGFTVTEYGLGFATFNVGDNGDAFGVADDTEMTVLDLLLATNEMTVNGLLYDLDGDGLIDRAERDLRAMANDVFSGINEQGDISEADEVEPLGDPLAGHGLPSPLPPLL